MIDRHHHNREVDKVGKAKRKQVLEQGGAQGASMYECPASVQHESNRESDDITDCIGQDIMETPEILGGIDEKQTHCSVDNTRERKPPGLDKERRQIFDPVT